MVKEILLWPSPKLRKKSEPVEEAEIGSAALHALIRDLVDTAAHSGGAGLSAIQIGVEKQIFVMRDVVGWTVWINPRIAARSQEKEMMSEGCLSLPGVFENVSRHVWVTAMASDENGQPVVKKLEGQLAQCFQHELDHLRGKMYPDRMDPGARDRLRARVRKNKGIFV